MTSGKGSCVGCKVVSLVVALGALNWGLVGLFDVNLVERLLGMGMAAKAVYIVIGIAGLMKLAWLCNMCPCQKDGRCGPKS